MSNSPPKILICGEAYGQAEEEAGVPFIGASGKLLHKLLSAVGINRDQCHFTNVFNLRPKPRNDVSNLCGPKHLGIKWMPYLKRGEYVREDYEPELLRLYAEVSEVRPNLVIALGASAAWAFCKTSGIKQIRGAPTLADPAIARRCGVEQLKVLPSYHPAALLREWKLRPVLFADLRKAAREAEFPDLRRPSREIWLDPTLDDMAEFKRRFIDPAPRISVDIETVGDQITMVGFSPTPDRALVVPFIDFRKQDRNYWRTFGEERAAWNFVREVTSMPDKECVGQNFSYDLKYLWARYGMPPMNFEHDTMLLHHALQLEMEKSLAFLGTLYTNESSWKMMRKTGTIKKED